MGKSKRGNNILTIMKKELRRFFTDRRMLMTIILPGVLIYFIYTLMGNALSENILGGGEDPEYRVLVHNPSATMEAIVQSAELNMTFYQCPDCTEVHDGETIANAINNGDFHLYVVFPENFDSVVTTYDPADDANVWFDKIKAVADSLGFASDMKAYKETPDAFKGSITDVSNVIRVAVTGRNNSPDLCTVMKVLGKERVIKRILAAAE